MPSVVGILYAVGARPNLVKMAPVIAQLRRRLPDARHVLVDTGQHYDRMMSAIFMEELGVPLPDHVLGVGSGTHAVQTARAMERIEPVIEAERPDLVIVPGDVNSTLAAALVAVKLGVRLAHLEAGLRSYDRSMPEEINRLVTDVLADMLWTPSRSASENLIREGISQSKIHFVGNIMIDSLEMMRAKIESLEEFRLFGLKAGGYAVVTMHRPSNVDDPERLMHLLEALEKVAADPAPSHQRWAKRLLSQLKAGERFPHSYPYPIQVWRLGGQQLLITLGGEPVATGFLGGYNGRLIQRSLDVEGIENRFIRCREEARGPMEAWCSGSRQAGSDHLVYCAGGIARARGVTLDIFALRSASATAVTQATAPASIPWKRSLVHTSSRWPIAL